MRPPVPNSRLSSPPESSGRSIPKSSISGAEGTPHPDSGFCPIRLPSTIFPMRRRIVAGNWKMHLTRAEAAAWLDAFLPAVEGAETELVVCPSFVALASVADRVRGSALTVGAQDVFWNPKGAFTGSISVGMLAEADASWAIVGHSETRGRFGKLEVPESTLSYFGETDETVNLKIKALLAGGLKPILCVGETLDEREAGQTDAVIREQLSGALAGISDFGGGVVAYEPVWAIGTGKTCDAAEAGRVCGVVRAALAEILGAEAAEATRVLY
ncbi:triose-phosphate isomerase, partial [bacterium]